MRNIYLRVVCPVQFFWFVLSLWSVCFSFPWGWVSHTLHICLLRFLFGYGRIAGVVFVFVRAGKTASSTVERSVSHAGFVSVSCLWKGWRAVWSALGCVLFCAPHTHQTVRVAAHLAEAQKTPPTTYNHVSCRAVPCFCFLG